MLKITCYDGVATIGGNKIMLRDGDSSLLLDFGKDFSAQAGFFDLYLQPRTQSALRDLMRLGLLPEIPGIYRKDLLAMDGAFEAAKESGVPEKARRLWESDLPSCDDFLASRGKPGVDGILLSHAHADHAQHLAFLHPDIPVCGSDVTAAILRATQDAGGGGGFEGDVWTCPERVVSRSGKTSTFPDTPKVDRPDKERARSYVAMRPGKEQAVGSFVVEAVPVDHSVPGACAYIVRCPSGKTVFYTGDLRFHGGLSLPPFTVTDDLRARTAGLRPDVVITEGTRISSDRRDDEADVEREITRRVTGCTGLALVEFGWKDITRFQTLLKVARAAGRVLVVSPKVALLWEYLRELDPTAYPDLSGDPNLRVYLKRTDSMLYSPSDYAKSKYLAGTLADWEEVKQAKGTEDAARLTTALRHYKGGIRAYDVWEDPTRYLVHAGYFEANELLDLDPPVGSVMIRASTEPFNAEMESDENRLANWLRSFGMLADDDDIVHEHVSGHAGGTDLRQFLSDMSPRAVLPVHTQQPEAFVEAFEKQCDVILPERGVEVAIS